MGSIANSKGFRAVIPLRNDDLSNGADADTLLWNQEVAILDTTELICELMKEEGVTRSELAHRMGKSKGYITQLLDGTRNMTIRTVSDVFTHLGHEFQAWCKSRDSKRLPNAVVTLRAEFFFKGQDESQPIDCAPSNAGNFSIPVAMLNKLTYQPDALV